MPYTIDEQKNLDRQRLLGQIYTKHTDQLLDSLDLPSEARCLDLGCGIGETTQQLANRLGGSGEVVGLDIDSSLLEVAKQTPSASDAKIAYQEGDAHDLKFEDASFDFVLARFLLQHLSEPEVVVREMLRVCRPGGIVAVQEPDLSKLYCFPPSWAMTRCSDLYCRLVASPTIGLRLCALFDELGYSSVNYNFELGGLYEGEALKRIIRLSHEATVAALIEQGLSDTNEYEAMLEEFKRIEEDDNTLLLGFPVFYGWVVRQ